MLRIADFWLVPIASPFGPAAVFLAHNLAELGKLESLGFGSWPVEFILASVNAHTGEETRRLHSPN
jgi:hypothetical protein